VIAKSERLGSILKAGTALTEWLDEGSRDKVKRFLYEISKNGKADSWEIFLEVGSEYCLFYIDGTRTENNILLLAADNKEELSGLKKQIFQLVPSLNQKGQGVQWVAENPQTNSRTEQVIFEDMSQLYGEMAALQRELGKKQVQLENLNQTISDYATRLEEMVEERTKKLRDSEAKFRGIFESSSLGIAISEMNGTIQTCNGELYKMVGGEEEVENNKEIMNVLYADFPAENRDFLESINRSQSQSKKIEKTIVDLKGNRKWAEVNLFPLFLENGQSPLIIHLIEDITKRKLDEQALMQAEKLSAVGKIAASLAHEINNPLQAIIGNIGLAAESLDNRGDLENYLEIASHELKRVSRIVSDLRQASRKPEIKERSPGRLEEVVEKVISLTEKKADEKGIKIIYKKEKNLPPVMLNAEQIEQVLLNLVMNALEAIVSEGEVLIDIERSSNPEGAHMSVTDSGEGIPEKIQPDIFEPFYTTKKEGLGLGLYISREIITAHRGTIKLVNSSENGTRFEIWLPAAG